MLSEVQCNLWFYFLFFCIKSSTNLDIKYVVHFFRNSSAKAGTCFIFYFFQKPFMSTLTMYMSSSGMIRSLVIQHGLMSCVIRSLLMFIIIPKITPAGKKKSCRLSNTTGQNASWKICGIPYFFNYFSWWFCESPHDIKFFAGQANQKKQPSWIRFEVCCKSFSLFGANIIKGNTEKKINMLLIIAQGNLRVNNTAYGLFSSIRLKPSKLVSVWFL